MGERTGRGVRTRDAPRQFVAFGKEYGKIFALVVISAESRKYCQHNVATVSSDRRCSLLVFKQEVCQKVWFHNLTLKSGITVACTIPDASYIVF